MKYSVFWVSARALQIGGRQHAAHSRPPATVFLQPLLAFRSALHSLSARWLPSEVARGPANPESREPRASKRRPGHSVHGVRYFAIIWALLLINSRTRLVATELTEFNDFSDFYLPAVSLLTLLFWYASSLEKESLSLDDFTCFAPDNTQCTRVSTGIIEVLTQSVHSNKCSTDPPKVLVLDTMTDHD